MCLKKEINNDLNAYLENRNLDCWHFALKRNKFKAMCQNYVKLGLSSLAAGRDNLNQR